MIADDVSKLVEPEAGQLREHRPLGWHAVRQDHVKGRYAVSRYDEQAIPEIVDVADLAAMPKFDPWKIRCK